jgi:PmbA protein
MDLEILHYVVDKAGKLGADDVVASISLESESQLKFVNNKIVAGMSGNSKTMWVFLVKDKRVTTTNIKDFSRGYVDDALKRLIKFAERMKPDEDYYGIAEGPFKYNEIGETFDKGIVNLGDKVVDYVECAVNAALEEGARRVSGMLEHSSCESFLVTSNDVEASERGTGISISVRALAEKNASGHKINCSRTLDSFKPEDTGTNAGRIAREALNPVKGEAGKFDVIFDPLPFANLLNYAINSASIFAVETGLSFFMNKLGKIVANEKVTILDDGSLPGGMSSGKFDEEGVPTQRNVVVENGVLRTYLHNTSTAKKYKTKTTGNAGLVEPEPWNVVMGAGDYKLDELFDSVKKGLYVTNTWYTRFQNYSTGDFSTIPRDGIFLIENGEKKGAASDVRISHNMLELLKNIDRISKEREQIVGWEVDIPSIVPAVLVRDVNITKSTGKFIH